MKRVVLDTNILVAGLRSRNGASFGVLSLVADRVIIPLVTTTLFLEYEAVLKRPELRGMTNLSVADMELFLRELAALAKPVDVHFSWRPQSSDPADEMVLEAAVNGRADALITHNLKDLAEAAARFGIPAVLPGVFLQEWKDE
ncbi:putative toxin-antitoxin system toxin component, PIN family [Pararhizobium arenae]|uniref:putative toxin-antitoxin system toxin component, PIN family n=1 Tax=Pararhizobium arenae TaxID=1856850 RepID=UPI00094B66BC|nr:putative toxin-antitoxin system toxin component, PIN family [Pararhizobium arenae]